MRQTATTYPGRVTTEETPALNDVFAFCNHLAWQVGGPVLIHDFGWGVVAYSTLNQPPPSRHRRAR